MKHKIKELDNELMAAVEVTVSDLQLAWTRVRWAVGIIPRIELQSIACAYSFAF